MTTPTASLATPYRTHTAGELRASDAGTSARLAGWVHRRRDHGQLIFLDLRDRHGLTQVVIDKADAPGAHEIASRVRSEFVVTVAGEVARRLEGTENPRLPTGEIELQVTDFEILSEAKTPPFYINEPDAPVDESLRLKYRYLDIRRQPMADRLLLRSRMVQSIRQVHHENGFVEVETPTLIKSTRRAPATSSSRAGSSRAASTRCRRARSSSSSCSWSRAWTATSRSHAATGTRTFGATASRSSPSSTWR